MKRAAAALVLFALPAWAEAADARSKLAAIKSERAAVERRLAAQENERKTVAAALYAAEREIVAIERRLAELAERRERVAGELERQRQRLAEREGATRAQRQRLAALLRLAAPPVTGLSPPFPDTEPARAMQERHFGAVLSAALAAELARLERTLTEERQLAEEIRRTAAELDTLARREAAEKQALESEKEKRQRALAQLAKKVQDTRTRLAELAADEARLARLIARLAQPTRRPPKGAAPSPRQETPLSHAERAPEPRTGTFLPPVAAAPLNRFGATRPEGTRWKGLFYRVPEGTPVRAVAAGTVVFADWLRGYGQVLIIDHGDELLSVYGHNQTLLVGVGRRVTRGETVATAGASGDETESGLYFELRNRGQAVDPARWLGG